MERINSSQSRKKFIVWGISILSFFSIGRIFLKNNKKKKTETVKMLTEEGKLVEIDKSLLASTGKKISNEELRQWIKK